MPTAEKTRVEVPIYSGHYVMPIGPYRGRTLFEIDSDPTPVRGRKGRQWLEWAAGLDGQPGVYRPGVYVDQGGIHNALLRYLS